MEKFIEKHSSILLGTHVNEICQPMLNELNLNYFCLIRIYNDGSRVVLTNAAEWQEHYLQKSYYKTDSFALPPENYIDGYYSANLFKNLDLYLDAASNFSIDYLISITDKNIGYCDIFHFGKNPQEQRVSYQTCLNKLEALYSFKEFFKEKSKKLIEDSDIFNFKENLFRNLTSNQSNNSESQNDRSKNFPVKRYSFDSEIGSVYFTPREIECLRWLIRGKTAREVSAILKIPVRTIEKHITNMKNKFNCRKFSQVVYYVMRSPVLKLLLAG